MQEKNVKGKIIQGKYKSLQRDFGIHYFNINYTTFQNKYQKIVNHVHETGRKKSRNQETFAIGLFRKKVGFAIGQCEVTKSNTKVRWLS